MLRRLVVEVEGLGCLEVEAVDSEWEGGQMPRGWVEYFVDPSWKNRSRKVARLKCFASERLRHRIEVLRECENESERIKDRDERERREMRR